MTRFRIWLARLILGRHGVVMVRTYSYPRRGYEEEIERIGQPPDPSINYLSLRVRSGDYDQTSTWTNSPE